MPRLFVAVELSPDARDVVSAVPRPDVEGLRWTTPEQWHVTLRFLGSVDEVATVVSALGSVRADAPDVVLGPEVSRFGQRVLHVPVSGLGDVAGAVVDATAGIGDPPDDRAFTGHVTLARARGRRRVDLRPLIGRAIAARWRVGEACLFASHLHPHGARYEVVERFPLS